MKGSSRTISRNYSNYSDNAEIPVEFLKTGKQKEKGSSSLSSDDAGTS